MNDQIEKLLNEALTNSNIKHSNNVFIVALNWNTFLVSLELKVKLTLVSF